MGRKKHYVYTAIDEDGDLVDVVKAKSKRLAVRKMARRSGRTQHWINNALTVSRKKVS